MMKDTIEPIQLGEVLPDHPFLATQGVQGNLNQLKGHFSLLYFYPKDNTPGCTLEAKAFSESFSEFQRWNVTLYGVSKDSLASHEKFKAKYDLPFELISDPNTSLCHLFNVLKEKSMFGKKYWGIVRSSFLIDAQGRMVYAWRDVKIQGHDRQVLEQVKKLLS